ncbi:MAG TPA: hypothetical protein VHO23_03060 [Candidatus Paceibacterota bacterium]|nr:hypothetical protein [Candidatus Paceibacterota bacterium]
MSVSALGAPSNAQELSPGLSATLLAKDFSLSAKPYVSPLNRPIEPPLVLGKYAVRAYAVRTLDFYEPEGSRDGDPVLGFEFGPRDERKPWILTAAIALRDNDALPINERYALTAEVEDNSIEFGGLKVRFKEAKIGFKLKFGPNAGN